MQPQGTQVSQHESYTKSKTRLRIGTGHPRYAPLISRDEITAKLRELGCEIQLVQEQGTGAFVVTVREEDVVRIGGQSITVRNHHTRLDVYRLKSESDRRMEQSSVPAADLRTLHVKFYPDIAQPFPPESGGEVSMKLVVKNYQDWPKKILAIDNTNTKHFSIDLSLTQRWQRVEITKTRPLTIPFKFKQLTGMAGVYHTFLFLTIETNVNNLHTKDRVRFPVEVRIGDKDLAALLAPKGEYVEKQAPELPLTIIAAFPPGRATKEHIHTPHDSKYVVPLGQYETPDEIQKQINAGDTYKEFQVWNTKDKWRQRLHQLLWWEEAYGRKQVTKFDLWDVPIRRVEARTEEPAAEIEVPGLEEKRPSLLKGDRVYVWQLKRGDDAAYEGIVWEVKKSSIVALFGPRQECSLFSVPFYREDPAAHWHVRFTYDRLPMRVKHRAVDAVDLDLVYPEPMNYQQAPLLKFPFEDLYMADNKKQSLALRSLMARTNLDRDSGRSLPFLLLGPFGTGKTRCLVEYARQVLKDPKAKMLFCSFSNSTADRFCEALSDHLDATQMFRLNAFRRDRGSVLPSVWRYCAFVEEQNVFDLPSLGALQRFCIVVCTASNAGSLYGLGCPRTHFSHIVIDEAARLEEPECLIPLSLATSATQVVLAGDPKQLGPKVQSSRTKTHGLEKSLPERLCQYHLYADRDNRVCVHLTQNYRSHSEIVGLLNACFYDRIGLTSCAPVAITESLSQWAKRNTDRTFPFLFISSSGSIAQREADSPSFFNTTEAEICAQILHDLFASKLGNLRQAEVGVFPATRKQTEKIRKTLRVKGMAGIDVGSVEEAHGKEFKAVVLSCVATARGVRSVEQDVRTLNSLVPRTMRLHDIGYCANAKRLNTAISRAAALVIVIGDPFRLANDPQWKQIIDACKARNSYIDAGSSDAFVLGDSKDADAEKAEQLEAAKQERFKSEQQEKREAQERERNDRASTFGETTERAPANKTPPALSASAAPFSPLRAASPLSTSSPLPAVGSPAAIRSSVAPAPSTSGSWPISPILSPDMATPLPKPALALSDQGGQLRKPVGQGRQMQKDVDGAARPPAFASPQFPLDAFVDPPLMPHLPAHFAPSPFYPFPMISLAQFQAMYAGSPIVAPNLQQPDEPRVGAAAAAAEGEFSSTYRSLNCKWNGEDLVSYRTDSTFTPPFRVLRLTEGEETLVIEFYTSFLSTSHVKSEGRTLLFSMFQTKPTKEVYFSHIPSQPAHRSAAVCHVRVIVPQGVRTPIDQSDEVDKLVFTFCFVSDHAPVSVKVLKEGKRLK